MAKVRSIKPARTRAMIPTKPALQEAGQQAALDLGEVRQRIADLVRNAAVEMVETTIDQVGKGHYLGMKYLFEMIGLYPATSADDTRPQDSMAATLLRRLGLPEMQSTEQPVTKDSSDLARLGAASEDGLE